MRRTVQILSVSILAAWLFLNRVRLVADPDFTIRLVLGTVLAVSILLRPRTSGVADPVSPRATLPALLAGGVAWLTGLLFDLHIAEWCGLLLCAWAGLRWGLPPGHGRDLRAALLVAFWIHPLPAQFVGPLELGMQWLSVQGAEWMLQALNVRVWADGMILRTGGASFGVPEACSGLRTATTVLMCTIGTGIWFRFTGRGMAGLVLLGFVQVVVLNVARVAAMVWAAPRMPPEWSRTHLHDTLGLFLLIAVVVVQFEALAGRMWAMRRAARAAEGAAPVQRPHAWVWLVRHAWVPVLLLLAALVLAGAVYKRRPAHRAAMIQGVVERLVETDLETAERAARVMADLQPGDGELRIELAQVLIQRAKNRAALRELDRAGRPAETVLGQALRALALSGAGDADRARAILDAMPPEHARLAGVAMVRAELAARRGDVAVVVSNLPFAAVSHVLTGRVRAMFPFLAAREQWQAILDCARLDRPFEENASLQAVAQAARLRRDFAMAADLADVWGRGWPADIGLLRHLAWLATERPGSEWETRFALALRERVNAIPADDVYRFMDAAFQMSRPDLGWLLYRRLEREDPAHPALRLAAARHGRRWFVFRRRYLGMTPKPGEDTVDMSFLYLSRADAPDVPLLRELATRDLDPVLARFASEAVEELARRERAGAVSPALRFLQPAALALAGRRAEALAAADATVAMHPWLKRDLLLARADILHGGGDWPGAYDTLKAYMREDPFPSLRIRLMFVDTLVRLNLPIYAFEALGGSERVFPGDAECRRARAAMNAAFGLPEEALHLLTDEERVSGAGIALLMKTGRFSEALHVCQLLGRNPPEEPGRDPLVLPPAEWNLDARRWTMPSAMETGAAISNAPPGSFVALREELARATASGQSAAAVRARIAAELTDDREAASACHRVALEQIAAGQWEEAAITIDHALKRVPTSPLLWRIAIGLRNGDARVIAEARRRCPGDPETWLAAVTAFVRNRAPDMRLVPGGTAALKLSPDELMQAVVSNAVGETGVHAAALVRAGDLLLREGFGRAAWDAADQAARLSPSYLPAVFLGLRAAVALGDAQRILVSGRRGAEVARDPWPFLQVVASVKIGQRTLDREAVRIMESMQERFAASPAWSLRLGDLYLRGGDPTRAYGILSRELLRAEGTPALRTVLAAAEAARRSGDVERAVRLLEQGIGWYGGRPELINNLAYTLAFSTPHLERAEQMARRLRELLADDFVTLETLAVVLRNRARVDEAEAALGEALRRVDAMPAEWLRDNLGGFDPDVYEGKYDEALDAGLDPMERTRRRAARDRLRPLARQLRETVAARTGGHAGP